MDTKYSHNLAAMERNSDAIVAAIRPHHRHSNDDAIADVLRIECEDMTADTPRSVLSTVWTRKPRISPNTVSARKAHSTGFSRFLGWQ
jgi:hypothetical protein